jgi:hypothetical protein
MIRGDAAAYERYCLGRTDCAGLYVLYEELFVRYSGIHGRYGPFGVGLALFGSGVVWLWFYCLGPIILKRLSREE